MSVSDHETTLLIPYCRQSAQRSGETDRTSLSLDAQESIIRTWAERNGYARVADSIRDHDLRGDNLDRPGIYELLRQVRPGVHIAVHKWDRFARAEHLQETVVQQIISLGGMIFSCTEPSDRFGRGIYGLMAEEYKRQLSERLQSVNRQRVLRGYFHGQPPWGFKRPDITIVQNSDGSIYERPTGDMVIDPDLAPLAIEMFERIADGDSPLNVAEDFANRGIDAPRSAMDIVMVRRAIRRPIYAGYLTYHKQPVIGDDGEWLHVPRYQLIDPELWRRANRALDSRTFVRSKNHSHGGSWLEGSIVHSCGARMYITSLGEARLADGAHHLRFMCRYHSHVPKCTDAKTTITARVAELAARLLLQADLAELIPTQSVVASMERSGLDRIERKQREKLVARRLEEIRKYDRAVQAWTAGVLEVDHLARIREAYDQALAKIDHELAVIPETPTRESWERKGSLLQGMRTVLDVAEGDDLATIMRDVGTLVAGEVVRIDYRPEILPYLRQTHEIASGFRKHPEVRRRAQL